MRIAEDYYKVYVKMREDMDYKKAFMLCILAAKKEAIEECKSIMYDYDIDEASAKMDKLLNELK